jgi:hypothetical protein
MALNIPVQCNNKAVKVAAERGKTMMQMTAVYVMTLWKVRNANISAY